MCFVYAYLSSSVLACRQRSGGCSEWSISYNILLFIASQGTIANQVRDNRMAHLESSSPDVTTAKSTQGGCGGGRQRAPKPSPGHGTQGVPRAKEGANAWDMPRGSKVPLSVQTPRIYRKARDVVLPPTTERHTRATGSRKRYSPSRTYKFVRTPQNRLGTLKKQLRRSREHSCLWDQRLL